MDKILTPETINPCVTRVRYAVRGAIPLLAEKIAEELRNGAKKSFDEVLFCNIGNPQSVGQQPLTFHREVLALTDHPALLDHPEVSRLFSEDAIVRARELDAAMPGGTGAYSASQGVRAIREDVARFIEARDGYPAEPDDVFLANGASAAITLVLQLLLRDRNDGILVPIPQYPIYSALIELEGAQAVGYYLDEDTGWRLDIPELERAHAEACARGVVPRALVVINPGNPTGQCLPEASLIEVAKFCREKRLVLMADEVYQENVYRETDFVSFKKVVRDLGSDYDDFELVSFHSTSKGILGECGRRGGYMELCGWHPEVKAMVLKLASVCLCPNLGGQVMTQLMVRPPAPGTPSYERYRAERDGVFEALARKAAIVRDTMSSLEGVSCQQVEGSMYAFPRVTLPAGAIAAAEAEGVAPDLHYCRSLLLETGICTVPGSGFGQREGTFHLRLTFLPPEDRLVEALGRFAEHHASYLERFSAAPAS